MTPVASGGQAALYHYVRLQCEDGAISRVIHALVLEAFVGPRPTGQQGAHGNGCSFDNRLTNLRWATPKENANDKEAHGSLLRGGSAGKAVLSDRQAQNIRRAFLAGARSVDLARKYRVSFGTIAKILGNRSYVDREYSPAYGRPIGEKLWNAKLSAEQVREIRAAAAAGSTYSELEARFGVTRAPLHRIVNRKSWRHVD